MSDCYIPLTKLEPRRKTLVAIDVERAWAQLPEGQFISTVELLLPGDMAAEVVKAKDGSLRHLSVWSVAQAKRRFRVKPGQQLVCDRTANTAAALYRRDIDALYSRQEIEL